MCNYTDLKTINFYCYTPTQTFCIISKDISFNTAGNISVQTAYVQPIYLLPKSLEKNKTIIE